MRICTICHKPFECTGTATDNCRYTKLKFERTKQPSDGCSCLACWYKYHKDATLDLSCIKRACFNKIINYELELNKIVVAYKL